MMYNYCLEIYVCATVSFFYVVLHRHFHIHTHLMLLVWMQTKMRIEFDDR